MSKKHRSRDQRRYLKTEKILRGCEQTCNKPQNGHNNLTNKGKIVQLKICLKADWLVFKWYIKYLPPKIIIVLLKEFLSTVKEHQICGVYSGGRSLS